MADVAITVSRSLPELARTWAPGRSGTGFGQSLGAASYTSSRSLPARASSPTLPRVPTAASAHRRVREKSRFNTKEASLTSTTRANSKAERVLQQYSVRMEEQKKEQEEREKIKASAGRDLKRKPTVEQMQQDGSHYGPEVFEDTVNEIGNQIDTLTRNIRMEHLWHGDDEGYNAAEAAKERELERKRRELAQMRARKKMAEARDPHRKVALRLENTRRFKREEVDKMDVPTHKLTFNGATGFEQETLVDVRLVRARCLLIDEGPKVGALLDLKRHKEIFGSSAMNATAPDKMFSSCATNKSFMMPDDAADREEVVRMRMQTRLLDQQFERLSAMRGEPTEAMLKSLEFRERYCAQLASFRGSKTENFSLVNQNRTEIWRRGKDAIKQRSVLGTLPATQRRTKKRICNNAAETKRARHHWKNVRFVGFCLVLYGIILKKRRAVDVLVNVLQHLGEWARLHNSMHKMIDNLKLLQRASRTFLATKRKRVDIMEKDWIRVEAKHLSPITKSMARSAADAKIEEEARFKSKAEVGTIRYQKMKERLMESELTQLLYQGAVNVDWRQFCIPARDRRDVCAHYYMIQLKKRIHSTKNLYSMIQHIVHNQREMHFFFKQFGAEPEILGLDSISKVSDSQNSTENVPHDFWHLSEENVLDLIAVVAKRLSRQEVWRDHPANREAPNNVMYRPAIHAALAKSVDGETPIREDLLRFLGETAEQRHKKSSKRRQSSNIDPKRKESKPKDGHMKLEDVLQSLEPRRLREYSEKNAARIETPVSRSGHRASRRPRPPSQHLLVWEDFGGNA